MAQIYNDFLVCSVGLLGGEEQAGEGGGGGKFAGPKRFKVLARGQDILRRCLNALKNSACLSSDGPRLLPSV